MSLSKVASAAIIASTLCCCAQPPSGRDQCTEKVIGKGSGTANIAATLLVPDHFIEPFEVPNGGVIVLSNACKYVLNANLSNETAKNLIDRTKGVALTHEPSGSKVVQARLWIRKFQNASGHPEFFVLSVDEITVPRELPTFTDARFFRRR